MAAYVRVRLSGEEKQRLRDDADLAALTVSDFIRRRAFGRQIVAEVDRRVIAELRRLGGLLKHLHVTSGGAYSKDTAAGIGELRSYVQKLASQPQRVSLTELQRIAGLGDPERVQEALQTYLASLPARDM